MSSIQFLTAVIVFSIKLAAICSELKNDDKDLSSSSNFTLTAESCKKKVFNLATFNKTNLNF